MPDEDEGHLCIYTVDEEDRNFKVCVTCKRIVYRTDGEIQADTELLLERTLRGR